MYEPTVQRVNSPGSRTDDQSGAKRPRFGTSREALVAGNLRSRRSAQIAAEIAAALMWGPKTPREILEYIGMKERQHHRLNRYLYQFHALGCIYIHSWPRKNIRRWAWNPKPFELKDVPHG